MPKDEFDFDDPMELNGMALLSDDDTMVAMAQCFIEEFMRLGYNHKQVFALFRNPHYLGMNMVLQNRGEPFVRDCIRDVFARWGRNVVWNSNTAVSLAPNQTENRRPSADRTDDTRTAGDVGLLSPPHEPEVGTRSTASTDPESKNSDAVERVPTHLIQWLPARKLLSRSFLPESEREARVDSIARVASEQNLELDATACDPMGAAIPKLNL